MFKCLIISIVFFITQFAFAEVKVTAFAGSLRNDSVNKKMVKEAARMAEEMGAEVTYIDLKDYPMPFFDEDLERAEGMPETVKAFRRQLLSSDVILIASPDYNHSFSGVLKNALDWVSRKEEGDRAKGVLKGIKVALMSASPGASGGIKGLVHLKDVLQDIGAAVVPTQVAIPKAYEAFNESGLLLDPKAKVELYDLVNEALRGKA